VLYGPGLLGDEERDALAEVRRGVKAVKLTFPEPTIDRPLQEATSLVSTTKSSISQSGNKAAAVDAPQQLDWTDHSRFKIARMPEIVAWT